ncbi:SLAP domain-containing protein [Pseudalkalibacillus sp. Hm43]|uniref:SLAP domain-containing protein n=1 Tax=Pseudalkalibacillus sp. Hm43 TaxID=3450742 RepID=UPI003F4389F5
MDDKLVFDPAWEKAIAPQDREAIEELHRNNPVREGELRWTPIRAALNHQGSLLAMVLMQNGLSESFTADAIDLTYAEKERGTIAESQFNLPNVHVPPGASMPWTFVFSQQKLTMRPLLQDWFIKLSEKSTNLKL